MFARVFSVAAALSALTAVQAATVTLESTTITNVGAAATSAIDSLSSEASTALAAYSTANAEVSSYVSSLLTDSAVRSLLDQVSTYLPSSLQTGYPALETLAVEDPIDFLDGVAPYVSTASFYSALVSFETSVASAENTFFQQAGLTNTGSAATTTSTGTSTSTGTNGVAAASATSTAGAGALPTRAAAGVVAVAAGVIGIALM
ncbi:hypothetical protein MMC25_007897 [Agyrium rufum]|nr:hypothetical protein [Agyrium rufum]